VRIAHPDTRAASAHLGFLASQPTETSFGPFITVRYGGEWVVVFEDEDGDPFAVELFDTPDTGPPEAAEESNKVEAWLSDSGYHFNRIARAEEPWFASWVRPH
jgi:hypothetical protein